MNSKAPFRRRFFEPEVLLRILVPLLTLLTAPMLAHADSGDVHDAACAVSNLTSGTYTIEHNGVQRSYRLQLPSGFTADHRSPLILVFHGWGGDENEFLDEPGVAAESGQRGYIVVAPRGLGAGSPDHQNNSWTFRGSATGVVDASPPEAICDATITPDYRYPSCRRAVARNTCSWTQCQDDDVAFVAALVQQLKRQLCIDPDRIFAVGGSNGGMFVWELGMNGRTAPQLRAIAPIIGLPHAGDLRPPGRSDGLPVLLVTGQQDPVVPPGHWDDVSSTTTSNDQDRFRYTGATAILKAWAAADGCAPRATEIRTAIAAHDADCRTYCPRNGERMPRVLDCRAPMTHDYGLDWSWKLALDFFDAQ